MLKVIFFANRLLCDVPSLFSSFAGSGFEDLNLVLQHWCDWQYVLPAPRLAGVMAADAPSLFFSLPNTVSTRLDHLHQLFCPTHVVYHSWSYHSFRPMILKRNKFKTLTCPQSTFRREVRLSLERREAQSKAQPPAPLSPDRANHQQKNRAGSDWNHHDPC